MHDVATRVKRMFGSEHAFVNFYLNLDRVPKYSTKQSLHLYRCRDQSQLIAILLVLHRVEWL